MKTISFSVNDHDADGDIVDEGIFLHCSSNVRIKVAKNIDEYDDFIRRLKKMRTEIMTQLIEIPECPYCDEPLDGPIINGLHETCNEALQTELDNLK